MVVTSSRRAARVNNKTKLLIYRGSDKVDLGSAEVIVWDHEQGASSEGPKHQHVGAKGVESGELLVSGLALSNGPAFEGSSHMLFTVKRAAEDGRVGGERKGRAVLFVPRRGAPLCLDLTTFQPRISLVLAYALRSILGG